MCTDSGRGVMECIGRVVYCTCVLVLVVVMAVVLWWKVVLVLYCAGTKRIKWRERNERERERVRQT